MNRRDFVLRVLGAGASLVVPAAVEQLLVPASRSYFFAPTGGWHRVTLENSGLGTIVTPELTWPAPGDPNYDTFVPYFITLGLTPREGVKRCRTPTSY